MKKLLFSTSLFIALFFSCEHKPQQNEEQVTENDTSKHSHGKANEYMHQNSVDELVNHFESPERDKYQKPEKVMEYLGDIKGKKVMDLGAGSGYFTFRLADAGAQVIAADVDDEFQQFIKQKKEKLGYTDEQIQLKKLPYDNPLLEKNEVDIVLLVNTYHHIENRIDYFSKVLNGLNSQGELIIIDYKKGTLPVGPPADHKIDKEIVQKELRNAGFNSIELDNELLEYQFIIRANKP